MKNKLLTFLMGIYFGIVLVKAQVASWYQIRDMFTFKSPYMYLVITSAIAVGMLSVFLIRQFKPRTVEGQVIEIRRKSLHKGVVIGSTLFGMGWALTGTCPGPIYVQIGTGSFITIVTFLGALTGMYLYAYFQPRLPHSGWVLFKNKGVTVGQ